MTSPPESLASQANDNPIEQKNEPAEPQEACRGAKRKKRR